MRQCYAARVRQLAGTLAMQGRAAPLLRSACRQQGARARNRVRGSGPFANIAVLASGALAHGYRQISLFPLRPCEQVEAENGDRAEPPVPMSGALRPDLSHLV